MQPQGSYYPPTGPYQPAPQQQYPYPQAPAPQQQYALPQPQIPPQYAPPPAPPQQAPAAVAVPPQVVAPTFGEAGPAVAELEGRAVALIPTQRTETKDLNDPTKMKPAIIADVYVMGSGTFNYGAAPKATPPRPYPVFTVQLPALFRNQTISNGNILRALDPVVGTGKAVAGVIKMSTIGRNASKPWNLEADDAATAAAGHLFAGISTGAVTLGEPASLTPQVPAQAAMPQQPTAASAPQYAPQPVQPQPQYGVPGYGQPYPPQAPPPQAPPQYAPPAAPPQANPYVGYPQIPPQAAPVPPGYDPNLWATLSPEQQQIAMANQVPPAAPPNPY